MIVGRSIAPPRRRCTRGGGGGADAGLDVVVDQVDFRQTPFDEAIDVLAKKSGTNIIVRWQVLEEAGSIATRR